MEKVLGFLKDFLPMIAYFPAWAQYTFAVALFFVVVSAIVFTANYKVAKAAQDGVADDKGLPVLIKAAAAQQKKYVLESVVMIVQPAESYYDSKAKEADVDVRFVYTIFAREDMKVSDFTEEVGTNYGTVSWLSGSETERPHELRDSDKKWDVDTTLLRGQRRTIVTAARYHYKFPFPELRELHGLKLDLNSDGWCYDNDSDVIGQVTILVESPFAFAAPSPNEDALVQSSIPLHEAPPEGTIVLHHNEKQANYTMVGAWHNIMPNQNCVLRVRYLPSPGTRFEPALALRPAA